MFKASRLEKVLDRAAVLWVAGSAAFATLYASGNQFLSLGCSLSAACAAYVLLARFRPNELSLPTFQPIDFEVGAELENSESLGELELGRDMELLRSELLLTFEHILNRDTLAPAMPEPLLLEDRLPSIDPEARVVYLFGRHRGFDASELRQRIDSHVERSGRGEWADELPSTQSQADAAQALSEALNAIRRSLA